MRILYPGELGTPRGGIGGDHTTKSCFKVLIGSLRLPVRLWVKAGGETNGCPQSLAKSSPDLRNKLGTSIRNNVQRDPMESEHLMSQKLSRLQRRRELG